MSPPPNKSGGQLTPKIGRFPPKLGVKTPKIFACGAIFRPPQPWVLHVLNFLGGGTPIPPQYSTPRVSDLGGKIPPPGSQNPGVESAVPPQFWGSNANYGLTTPNLI